MNDPVEVWSDRIKLSAAFGLWAFLFGLLTKSTELLGFGGFVLIALGVGAVLGVLYGACFFLFWRVTV